MNLLEVLGCIGGVLFLINWILVMVKRVKKFIYKWQDYKAAYDEKYDANKEQIGFKQEEKKDKNDKKDTEDFCEETKIKLNYNDDFTEYWESEPVDNEFIEEREDEEYEDELDKYPLLKTKE